MCEPTTWVMIAGLVLTAAAGYQQHEAQGAMADAAEKQSEENAKVAEAQAQNATSRGLVEEDRRRQLLRQQLGAQRAAIAGSGLDMSMGTPLELLGDTASIGEQDALTIRANAAREAWGYRTQAVDYKNQGRVARAQGKNAQTGTILSTAGNMLSMAGGGMGGGGGGGGGSYTTNAQRSSLASGYAVG